MSKYRFSRRSLLKASGLGGAAHLLLPELHNPAYAQENVPKMFILLYSHHGVATEARNVSKLWGNGNGGLTLGDHLQPLSSFKDDMVLLSGLKMKSPDYGKGGGNAGHVVGQVNSLTSAPQAEAITLENVRGAMPTGPSIDQEILTLLKEKNGGKSITPVDSVQLGILDNTYEGQMLGRGGYERRGDRILPLGSIQDPYQGWRKLFEGWNPGGGPVSPGDDLAVKQRRLVSSFARGQYDSVANKVKDLYGVNSRDRFQAHVDYMREFEKSLMSAGEATDDLTKPVAASACEVPAKESMPRRPITASGWLAVTAGNQQKLAHLGLACGRTRFVTLNIEETVTADPGIHDKIHNKNEAGTKSYYTEISKQVATLFQLLKDTPTADGKNMMYHSVILWAGELGYGNHSWDDVNWVVAGQAGGDLETGRFVNAKGRSTTDLFVSVGKLMDSGMTKFGDQRTLDRPLEAIKG